MAKRRKWILPLALAGAAGLWFLAKKPKAVPPIYTCSYCGAQFSTEAELLAHIAATHPGPMVYYTCPTCGATFLTQEELDAHILAQHVPEGVVPAGSPVPIDPETGQALAPFQYEEEIMPEGTQMVDIDPATGLPYTDPFTGELRTEVIVIQPPVPSLTQEDYNRMPEYHALVAASQEWSGTGQAQVAAEQAFREIDAAQWGTLSWPDPVWVAARERIEQAKAAHKTASDAVDVAQIAFDAAVASLKAQKGIP